MANDEAVFVRMSKEEVRRLVAIVKKHQRSTPGGIVSKSSIIRMLVNQEFERFTSAPLTTEEKNRNQARARQLHKAVVEKRKMSWDVLDKDDFRTASFETRAIARDYASIWSRDFPDEAPFRVKRSK